LNPRTLLKEPLPFESSALSQTLPRFHKTWCIRLDLNQRAFWDLIYSQTVSTTHPPMHKTFLLTIEYLHEISVNASFGHCYKNILSGIFKPDCRFLDLPYDSLHHIRLVNRVIFNCHLLILFQIGNVDNICCGHFLLHWFVHHVKMIHSYGRTINTNLVEQNRIGYLRLGRCIRPPTLRVGPEHTADQADTLVCYSIKWWAR
jgi:hypothetical protein